MFGMLRFGVFLVVFLVDNLFLEIFVIHYGRGEREVEPTVSGVLGEVAMAWRTQQTKIMNVTTSG